ncbi:MAG TPA: DUF2284 domain-containing protein [Firmicutes bacterium]|nr:DUF2284 domain-containing protein [Bacillota bacterium]
MTDEEAIFWRKEATSLGASLARVIRVDQILMDPRTRLKCRVPLCPSYGRNLMCPPFLPSYAEAETMVRKYSYALLLKLEVNMGDGPDRDVAYEGAISLHRLVNSLEKLAFQKNYRFAAGLIGGTCRLCARCAAESGSTHCRHPFEARPSMEAMGIDVVGTLESLGLKKPVFPATATVEWVGLLLLE